MKTIVNQAIKKIFHDHFFDFCFLGFCSGIPFLLTLGTLSFWLSESGITKTHIGLFTWVSLPYAFKFVWAGFIDRYDVMGMKRWSNHLKRYQQWYVFSQLCMIILIFVLGSLNPSKHLILMAFCAIAICFFATIQDLVVDACRIHLISLKNTATASALEAIGFRLGMIVSGAGALYIAHIANWFAAYSFCGFCCFLGTIIILKLPPKAFSSNEANNTHLSFSLKETFENLKKNILFFFSKIPFFQFFTLLLGIKFSDTLIQSMMAPFLIDLHITKIEFAYLTKILALPLILISSTITGFFFKKFGMRFVFFLTFFLSILTSFSLWIQVTYYPKYVMVVLNVAISSILSGIVSTTLITYLSLLTKGVRWEAFFLKKTSSLFTLDFYTSGLFSHNTAFFFSFLYSLGSIVRVLSSMLGGFLADFYGWKVTFLISMIVPLFTLFFFLYNSTKIGQKP
jgi:PAT family beta-lactamase induction signal transducer AmpG